MVGHNVLLKAASGPRLKKGWEPLLYANHDSDCILNLSDAAGFLRIPSVSLLNLLFAFSKRFWFVLFLTVTS